jgi:hypothetical protein
MTDRHLFLKFMSRASRDAVVDVDIDFDALPVALLSDREVILAVCRYEPDFIARSQVPGLLNDTTILSSLPACAPWMNDPICLNYDYAYNAARELDNIYDNEWYRYIPTNIQHSTTWMCASCDYCCHDLKWFDFYSIDLHDPEKWFVASWAFWLFREEVFGPENFDPDEDVWDAWKQMPVPFYEELLSRIGRGNLDQARVLWALCRYPLRQLPSTEIPSRIQFLQRLARKTPEIAREFDFNDRITLSYPTLLYIEQNIMHQPRSFTERRFYHHLVLPAELRTNIHEVRLRQWAADRFPGLDL